MSETIQLTQNKVTIVDDEDYTALSQHKWFAHKRGNNFYAVRRPGIRMHREITKVTPGLQIDHINHDSLDNRKCNLRICNTAQNRWNSLPRKNNKSGFKGVTWQEEAKKWQARIQKNGCPEYLGLYFCIVKAAKAYDIAARRLFGEFAYLNFTGE